jgi:F0F1-type ATP synthase assembly protein I
LTNIERCFFQHLFISICVCICFSFSWVHLGVEMLIDNSIVVLKHCHIIFQSYWLSFYVLTLPTNRVQRL